MSKLHIKKGDTVYVNAGNCKGQTGKVLKVLVEEQRAVVEGINIVSKSQKPSAKNPQGGIVKQEAPIHISNLNVVDPKTGKPTRIKPHEYSRNWELWAFLPRNNRAGCSSCRRERPARHTDNPLRQSSASQSTRAPALPQCSHPEENGRQVYRLERMYSKESYPILNY